MAFISTTKEQAFRQDIEEITEHEDIEFARKHFAFVHRYSCKEAPLPQTCIEEGRSLYTHFAHQLKLVKQQAFYCMGGCKESECYKECLDTLKSKVNNLYDPLKPTLEDYLLKFKP